MLKNTQYKKIQIITSHKVYVRRSRSIVFVCDVSNQLKVGCCNCKVFYVNFMVTTKKIPTKDRQKEMRKGSGYVTTHKKISEI